MSHLTVVYDFFILHNIRMSSANASYVPRPLTWVQVRDLPRGAVCILDYKMHILEFYMSICLYILGIYLSIGVLLF